MTSNLDLIRAEIAAHQANAWARDLGYEPLYTAAPGARVALIGQAALLGQVGQAASLDAGSGPGSGFPNPPSAFLRFRASWASSRICRPFAVGRQLPSV